MNQDNDFEAQQQSEIAEAAAMMAAMPGFSNQSKYRTLAGLDEKTLSKVEALDPLDSATAFGGMLTIPALQTNCLRLEALVHTCLSNGHGKRRLSSKMAGTLFGRLAGSLAGRFEDPAEDLFSSTIRTPRGNFRVLEGLWEANTFLLERFINVAESMPRGSGYDGLRQSVYALLRLSDIVCHKAKLNRYHQGAELGASTLNKQVASQLSKYRARIRFSQAELEQLGINSRHLTPFMLAFDEFAELDRQECGRTMLERRPIIATPTHIYLTLPTAVGAAIRYFMIGQMQHAGLMNAFLGSLSAEYAHLFNRTQLLGGLFGAPIHFHETGEGLVAEFSAEIDRGRYLQCIFTMDQLADFDETGLSGLNPDSVTLADHIETWTNKGSKEFSRKEGFRSGITLVVSCGVGRGMAFGIPEPANPNWDIQFVSAYDLFTLSWVPDLKPLTLWRLLSNKTELNTLGTELHNVNGLINLVAWSRSLDNHLIPHGSLPDEFGAEGGAMVWINQNSLLQLRSEVAQAQEARVELDVHGRWVPIRKNSITEMEQDRQQPLYASEESPPRNVYLASKRSWWADVVVPDDIPGGIFYEWWKTISVWLAKAAPVLDGLAGLDERPLQWEAEFSPKPTKLQDIGQKIDFDEACSCIEVSIDRERNIVKTSASARFNDAIFHVDNIAERALVKAFVKGVLDLANAAQTELEDLQHRIIPDTQARHSHAFMATAYRHHVRGEERNQVTFIDGYDEAQLKLGLGWQIRNRSEGSVIEGKAECQKYLNSLVAWLENSLLDAVRQFNRIELLLALCSNHENAMFDRDRWRRTAGALIALRDDKEQAREFIHEHEFRLNAVFQATRILVEMALCEAPIEDGGKPGELDLSRLMTEASALFLNGGYSDAIRWDAMEPKLRITPLGDIHANYDFLDDIVEPHSREAQRVQMDHAIKRYPKYLEETPFVHANDAGIELQFLEAWTEQFGADFDETRIFIEHIENVGYERKSPVIQIRRSDFGDFSVEGTALSAAIVESLFKRFTLPTRSNWREMPTGFTARDQRPWLMRRDLSFIRRPILQIDNDEDPTIIVAPGMLRDTLAYCYTNFRDGSFPEAQLSPKMRAWKHHVEGERGTALSEEVGEIFRSNGWNVEIEVKLTKVMRRKLDKDYGDIDVLVWSKDQQRVLAIECKDVQFRKTLGEMAEQLADFRGLDNEAGKPDYLNAHGSAE